MNKILVMDGKRHVFLTGIDYHAVELLTPDAADELAAKLTESARRVRSGSRVGAPGKLPEKPTPEIMDMLRQGRWINAIKALRAARGLTLKDAKDRVDEWRERYGLLGLHPDPVDLPPRAPASPEQQPSQPADGTKAGRGTTWSDSEKAILDRYIDTKRVPYAELLPQLPGRNKSMIKDRIQRTREAKKRDAEERLRARLRETPEPETIIIHPDILTDAIGAQVSAAPVTNSKDSSVTADPSPRPRRTPPATSPMSTAADRLPSRIEWTNDTWKPLRGAGPGWRTPLIATKLPDEGPIRWPDKERKGGR